MKVSFDFDSTLSTERMQALCKTFMKLGAEVHITTSRSDVLMGKPVNNEDLFEVSDYLGIPRHNITFTKYEDKYKFVKDFDMHFDDDIEEVFLINQFPGKCIGLLYEEKHSNGIIDY